MPVKFKGASEYTDNYPEFQSYKSASFQPSPEQAARTAGLQTTKTALTVEPPLQRKKRITGPTESLSADYYDGQPNVIEYALLGQQDKFASNVKYRPKSGNFNNNRLASPPKQLKLDQVQPDSNIEKHKPAPIVDTKKFTEPTTPPTPLAPRKPKDFDIQPKKTKAIQTQPKAKTVQTQDKPVKQGQGQAMKQTVVLKEAEPHVKQGLKDKNLSDVLGVMKKMKPSMNEFTQTDVDKGVIDSAPEAPAEYAMKFKAGVAPARASRKQSEYQREFEWKNRVASSPMLAAEHVVYNSKVGPVKTSGFPKTSEYKAQFKKWKAIENEPVPAVKHAAQQRAAMKNRAVKRSKSVGAVDHRAKQTQDEEEAKPDRPKPLPHHGKLRKVVTEYAANFKPPQKFNYDKGAWKGADPPHIFAQKSEPEVAPKKPALSNWYAEVLELRRKAAEYKKRAQGTHFSREHLVQLLAKQAGFWDIPTARSESSSTLSALSLDAGNSDIVQRQVRKHAKVKKDFSERNLVDFDSCHATIADSEIQSEGEAEVYEDKPQVQRKGKGKNFYRKMAWLEEHQKGRQEPPEPVQDRLDDERSESPYSDIVQEGRLPTPLWRQSSKVPRKPRHHLDRTTPSVGGAILSSPPQPIRSKSYGSDSAQDTLEEESDRREFGKTYNLNRLRTTPTFGHLSEDTHVLRDDDASVDRPMKATYMSMPSDDLEDLEQENQDPVVEPAVRRQSRRKERIRPAGIPSTLHEQMGETYNKPVLQLPPDDDDDNVSLSLSVRSIASSCSLASDVYERAKNRRDNFWGKSDIATR